MTKFEQMDELILKVQKDEELQKAIAEILQHESPDDTAEADKWLADNGYEFTLMELIEHLEDGVPLSDDQLEAVAGGGSKSAEKSKKDTWLSILGVGVGGFIGALACTCNSGKNPLW